MAKEHHRPKGESTLILLNTHILVNVSLHQEMTEALRPHQRSFFFLKYRQRQLMQRLTTGQSAENRCLWSAQKENGHWYHTALPLMLRKHCGKEERKTAKATG